MSPSTAATYNGPDSFLSIAGVTLRKGVETSVDADQLAAIKASEYDVTVGAEKGPTKEELSTQAEQIGAEVPSGATKAQIEKAITAKQAELDAAAGQGTSAD